MFSIAPVPHILADLPEGVDSIRKTLKYMVQFGRRYGRDMEIRQLVERIIADVPERDYAGELRALQNWVRDEIRYTRDPVGAEMVQTPKRTLVTGMGDCDDKSTLLAAMLQSVGIPARFAAVGMDGQPYSHVFVEAKLGTRWIPCETIVPGKEPGWYPPGVTRRMVAHIR